MLFSQNSDSSTDPQERSPHLIMIVTGQIWQDLQQSLSTIFGKQLVSVHSHRPLPVVMTSLSSATGPSYVHIPDILGISDICEELSRLFDWRPPSLHPSTDA